MPGSGLRYPLTDANGLPDARWLLALAGVVAFAGCQRLDALRGAADDGGAAPATSAEVSLGHQIRTSLYRLTVRGVRQCPPTAFEEPEKGHTWLGVDVELEALGATPVPANPFYARLVDADGHRYRARFDGCSPALDHPPLAQNAAAHGVITFEIPEHASGLVFSYDPRVPDQKQQEARVDLGR